MKFKDRIKAMNDTYRLPVNEVPCYPIGLDIYSRVRNFKVILEKEIYEANDILGMIAQRTNKMDVIVAIADLLADVTVYCRSEAMKYGIPLEEVIDIVMDSNESKLGNDGEPIFDEYGKFLKGPNYWKPEQKIKDFLESIP